MDKNAISVEDFDTTPENAHPKEGARVKEKRKEKEKVIRGMRTGPRDTEKEKASMEIRVGTAEKERKEIKAEEKEGRGQHMGSAGAAEEITINVIVPKTAVKTVITHGITTGRLRVYAAYGIAHDRMDVMTVGVDIRRQKKK